MKLSMRGKCRAISMLSAGAGEHSGDTEIGAGNLHSLCWDKAETACHKVQEIHREASSQGKKKSEWKSKEAETWRIHFQGEKLTSKKKFKIHNLNVFFFSPQVSKIACTNQHNKILNFLILKICNKKKTQPIHFGKIVDFS